MPKLFYSQFSGGGGADAGALAAGLTPIGGVEFRADIAAVYADNFGHALTIAPVEAVDYVAIAAALPGPIYHQHASPSCKRASVANANAGEADEDIAAALGVCRALEAFQPVIFTLENVRAYAGFAAYARILATLHRLGYGMRQAILNAADYGVAQTRERLILRAVRGCDDWRVSLPAPTHQQKAPPAGQLALWDAPPLPRWVGWYEAIEDLIPTLPPSQFAPWQLARLPEELRDSALFQGMKHTIKDEYTGRAANEPARVVDTTYRPSHMPRAFIVGGGNTQLTQVDSKARRDSEPMFTVSASDSAAKIARAWLVSNAKTEYGDGLRRDDEPALATTGQQNGRFRAWLTTGRVVKMTPEALARFQSFPRWYRLPPKASLACEIIGNAVPSLLFQRIAERAAGE